MSFRYSAILVTATVCMMYGVALPIMFPIGAFTYFNYYVVDRILITYFYQRPPIYDDKLNNVALSTMKISPILLLFFGYWAMGNMQIFNSKVADITNTVLPIVTDHSAEPSMNQALPMFIAGLAISAIFIFTQTFQSCLKKAGLGQGNEIFEVDEKVGSYFESVSVDDRKRLLAEELHAQNKLNIHTVGKWATERLRTAIGGWRVIKNAPNYDILANQSYQQAFQFTPIEMCNNSEEEQISETIIKVLNMAY